MLRIFGSPHRYVQGPDALAALPHWAHRLAGDAPVVVVSDPVAWAMVRERVEAAFATAGRTVHGVTFDGDVTRATIDAAVATARAHAPGVVVGLGGGKSLDVGKAVSQALGTAVITAPTIASNDSPTSMSYALYDEHHVLVDVQRMPHNPHVVLVDTALIAAAPKRFLLSGIGDALAKKFEGEAADIGGGRMNGHGTWPLRTGLVIGDGCYRTIRQHAEAALAVAGTGQPNAAFEHVVEACVLMSGLGFENTGLSIAHSMTRGLQACAATARCLHGEHVAYGLLVQLHTEGRPQAEIDDLRAFYARIGLPRTLRDLGLAEWDEAQLQLIVERSMAAPHLGNVPRPVTAGMMEAAIRTLEQRQN